MMDEWRKNGLGRGRGEGKETHPEQDLAGSLEVMPPKLLF